MKKWKIKWWNSTVNPIRRVAFYDRASSKPQFTNGARMGNCSDAEDIAQAMGWELIPSNTNPNGTGCFLDLCSGIATNPHDRKELYKILGNPDIDTIAFIEFPDRWCRGLEAGRKLDLLVKKANKNLVLVQSEEYGDECDKFHKELFLIVAEGIISDLKALTEDWKKDSIGHKYASDLSGTLVVWLMKRGLSSHEAFDYVCQKTSWKLNVNDE